TRADNSLSPAGTSFRDDRCTATASGGHYLLCLWSPVQGPAARQQTGMAGPGRRQSYRPGIRAVGHHPLCALPAPNSPATTVAVCLWPHPDSRPGTSGDRHWRSLPRPALSRNAALHPADYPVLVWCVSGDDALVADTALA